MKVPEWIARIIIILSRIIYPQSTPFLQTWDKKDSDGNWTRRDKEEVNKDVKATGDNYCLFRWEFVKE